MADTGDLTLPCVPRKRKADEIDTAEEHARSKVIEVVPNADVTFKVGTGEDAIDVKVLGTAMGLASPVLSRMLFGQFAEAETKVVNLPEEDPKVFLQFCNIVHHRPVELYNLESQQLAALAILSDMWHCQEIVATYLFMITDCARKVLKETEPTGPAVSFDNLMLLSPEDLPSQSRLFNLLDVVDICAMLSWKMDFWHATRHYLALCRDNTKRATQSGAKVPSILNPDGETVYDAIARNQSRYTSAFLNDVRECINKDIKASASLVLCQAAKHGMLHLLLCRQNIVLADTIKPLSLGSAMSRILWVAERLKKGVFDRVTNKCITEKKRYSLRAEEDESCYCRRAFDVELEAIVKKHSTAMPGACLFCFRAGKPDFLVDRDHCHSCEEANAGEDSTAVTTK